MKGRAPNPAFNAGQVFDRTCESLLGICRGVMADECLNEKEVHFLDLWLRDNQELACEWPASVLADRVARVLEDGKVTAEELQDLESVLQDMLGGGLQSAGAVDGLSTNLPLDSGEDIVVPGQCFCFTGGFLYGPRSACHRAVDRCGGIALPSVTQALDYLVIGVRATGDWKHSSYGRKIEKAVEYRERGFPVRIISEQDWTTALTSR